MNRYAVLGLAAAALATAPALAEDSTVPATNAAVTSAMSGGMQMGTAATAPVKFADAKSSDLMTSRLIGTNVYNNANESIGQIEDFAIGNGKTVDGVIVSVGGFLGMGEHYVLVQPSSITLAQTDGTLKAFMNTDKATLKSAPAFNYNKKSAS